MDQYSRLIFGLPRLLPHTKTDGISQKRYGVHDDTQFEKVYSFLACGLETPETQQACFEVWMMDESFGILKTLLGEPWVLEEGGEEYLPPHAHRLRALALGLKMFGKLLSIFSSDGMQVNDENFHPCLAQQLPEIWNGWWEPALSSRFPLLRFSGFFGLQQAFHNPYFAEWYEKNTHIPSVLASAIQDDSTYVKELCSQLISELIHYQSSAINSLAYSSIVNQLIHVFNKLGPLELYVRMELAWALTNKDQTPFSSRHAEKFLREAGFLANFWESWRTSERRARDQASETIERALGSLNTSFLFGALTYDSQEASEHGIQPSSVGLEKTICSILEFSGDQGTMFKPVEDNGMSALGLIAALVGIFENRGNSLLDFRRELLLGVHVQLLCLLISEPVLRDHIKHEVFKEWLASELLEKIEVQMWDATCAQRFELVYSLLSGLLKLMLNGFAANGDLIVRVVNGHLTGSAACDVYGSVAPMKLLRLGLDILRSALQPTLVQPCQSATFHDIMLRLLLDSGLDAPAFNAVLEAMQEGISLVQEGRELAEALQRRSYDLRWAARDSVVEFIGKLFARPMSVYKFAIDYSFHEILIHAIGDGEPYVRATAYHALARLASNPELPSSFVLGVESALSDAGNLCLGPESGDFQHAPHLELLIALLEFHTRNLELEMPACFPIQQLARLVHDGDSEVVIRALRFIHSWWRYEIEYHRLHPSTDPRVEELSSDFFKADLHNILISKLDDSSRVVRQTTIDILLHIEHDCLSNITPDLWARDSQLLTEKITSVDLPRLQRNCEPELIYPETRDLDNLIMPSPDFEPQRPKVNVSKMVDDSGWFTSDSDPVDEDDTEDYNVMDCY
ncbi:hypothetical protein DSO57_1014204 [Entomophthora muscae]|uniref:Uncharacterized protein n=2 Tax=Entomophthora muscae TaxID=34485 RepID=A0ACC2T5L3_9FUNG|nr:hypothetical protein DSO57_1014204 [Entomophthora muscae]